ncbi:hypothetical protein FRB90_008608, partial [Tulasnella sp. 427]
WPSSSTASSTLVPVTVSHHSSNVPIIAGASAGAVAVLAIVGGLLAYFKFFRHGEGGRGEAMQHVHPEEGADLDPTPYGGQPSQGMVIVPEKPPISPPPFHHASSSIGSSMKSGMGGTVPGFQGGGGAGDYVGATHLASAHHGAVPVIIPAGAKRRESDYGQQTLPTPYMSVNPDAVASASGSPRQSIAGDTTTWSDTQSTANEKPPLSFSPFVITEGSQTSHNHHPRDTKAAYMAGSSSPIPRSPSIPGSEGSTKRDSVLSSSISYSPDNRRSRPLPIVPGNVSGMASPPPQRAESISSPRMSTQTMETAPTTRPFSPESRPMSPAELPPPSYDEAQRIRLRESATSSRQGQP